MVYPTNGLWRQVPSLWRGAPEQQHGAILRWSDQSLSLTLDSEVTLDGELFASHAAAPLQLTVERPVTFLT
jgi:hypothetical protein